MINPPDDDLSMGQEPATLESKGERDALGLQSLQRGLVPFCDLLLLAASRLFPRARNRSTPSNNLHDFPLALSSSAD